MAFQHANGQYCRINVPFQLLMNPPSCIAVLYAKEEQAMAEQCNLSVFHAPHTFMSVAISSNLWIILSNPMTLGSTIPIIFSDKTTSAVSFQQPFYILRSSPACSATSRFLHPSLHYEDHTIMVRVSLDTTNINAINISTPYFMICQHFNSNWSSPHLQKMTNIPGVPVTQLYKYMINTSEPVH